MYQPFKINFINTVVQTQQNEFIEDELNSDKKIKQPTRWQQLYEQGIESTQKKQKNITIHKEQYEQDLKNQCTFTPIISNKSKEIQDNRDIATRNEQWLKNKENKINLQKMEENNKELENCSFRPTLDSQKNSINVSNISEFEKEKYMNRGTTQFLMRQESARKMKIPEQKKQQKKSHVTIPQEFNLTKSQKSTNNQPIYQQSIMMQKQDKTQDISESEYKLAQLEIRNLIRNMEID